MSSILCTNRYNAQNLKHFMPPLPGKHRFHRYFLNMPAVTVTASANNVAKGRMTVRLSMGVAVMWKGHPFTPVPAASADARSRAVIRAKHGGCPAWVESTSTGARHDGAWHRSRGRPAASQDCPFLALAGHGDTPLDGFQITGGCPRNTLSQSMTIWGRLATAKLSLVSCMAGRP